MSGRPDIGRAIISQSVSDSYVKDCMKARGYERVSSKNKQRKKRSNGKNN